MCEAHAASGAPVTKRALHDGLDAAMAVSRFLLDAPELRGTADGTNGYGETAAGQRILVVTDSHYDPRVAEAVAEAMRERGAKVDQIVLDNGPDRDFRETDEFDVLIRRESWRDNPRRYEGVDWVEQLAAERGYDLVVMGRGGPANIFPTPYRYENIPWFDLRQLAEPATTFPRAVNIAINRRLHELLTVEARGGCIRLVDPEGTDMSWPMLEGYYEAVNSYWRRDDPVWGHVMAHAPPPIVDSDDGGGVLAGTLNHFSRPFPQARVHIERGQVVGVDGGGEYGEAWRALLEETRDVTYPGFPRSGLFFLWEVAIGTNPKIRPEPVDVMRRISSGGVEKERHRSGALHLGLGTAWRAEAEDWAAAQGIAHGHLHIHLMFSTMVIETADGRELPLITDGRLTALDDPGVRDAAARVGDPDEVLAEAWTPLVPGITCEGEYHRDYAEDPAAWIYSGERDRGIDLGVSATV